MTTTPQMLTIPRPGTTPRRRRPAITGATLLVLATSALVASATAAQTLQQVESRLLAYDTKEARAALGKAADAQAAQRLVAEGRILEQERKYDEAIAKLKQAGDAAADSPAPWVYLGEVQLRKDNAKGADEAFRRAQQLATARLEKNQSDAEAHYLLGVARQRLKSYTAAAESLERARQLEPDNPLPLYQLGVTRVLEEKWQAGIDRLTEAITRNSGIAYAYYYRGIAAGRIKRNDLLIADLDRFLALAPGAPEASRAKMIVDSARR